MKPGVFQGKNFPFTPKRRKKSLGSQCNNIIDTRHDLAAFQSKLVNVSWLRSYTCSPSVFHLCYTCYPRYSYMYADDLCSVVEGATLIRTLSRVQEAMKIFAKFSCILC